MFIIEILQYDFMVRALVVGVFTAVSAAVLGHFVVASRQAVVSDMLAHTALVGVGLGIFWNVAPEIFAFIATLFSCLILWWLNRRKSEAPEAVSMLLLTGGLALALLFVHLNKNNPLSLDTYLFGSILTITEIEMYVFIGLNILLMTMMICLWRSLLSLVFDADFLQIRKSKIVYELVFMIMIAVIVGVGLKVVGGLLIGALLVIPVLIVQSFSQSFLSSVWRGICVNIFAMLLGLISSFYLDIPTSSAIVLSLVVLFVFSRLQKIFRT